MPEIFYRVLDRLMRDLDAFRVRRSKGLFKVCGERVFISPKCVIWPESGLSVGDDVQIHSFTHIFASGGVTIGSGTLISSNCSITSVTHGIHDGRRFVAPQIDQPVHIGRNVWIGTGAVVLPGISIGDNAVVGAGSVVTKDVAANTVAVGNPARFLKNVEAGD